MKVLFVHQNLPGQFKHLAPALAAAGNEVVGMTMNDQRGPMPGVKVVRSQGKYQTGAGHPWARDFDTKIIRAEASLQTAKQLKSDGFEPDVIVAHPAWGESLFLHEVWPKARIGLYCEMYYHSIGLDRDFDPEFPVNEEGIDAKCVTWLRNLPQLLQFEHAQAGISPTQFQANTYPEPFRSSISVIHDGIDTKCVAPGRPYLDLSQGLRITADDEIVTFINRNLEPYRGYHIFMRALPELLRRRPKARVVIVGAAGVGYGAAPPKGTWRELFLNEVAGQLDLSRVHFVGQIPYRTYLQLLQVSSLHIYLTYPFVVSWSLLEAMAVGAPILASDTAPVREFIEDGDTGRLFPFFDPGQLADVASEMLADQSSSRKLGSRARQTVQSGYDLRSVCLPHQIEWVSALADSPS